MRHRKLMLPHSAAIRDEEVGAAKLSCGLAEPTREEQRERRANVCVSVRGGGWRAVRVKTVRAPHLQ